MPNTLLTISMITRESLRVLENSLTFTKQIRREYDDRYGISGAKIGTVLNIRKPPRYNGRTGQTLSIEDATETSVPLALSNQKGVDLAFTSLELTLDIDDFSKRFLTPAIASVANTLDYDGTALTSQVYNIVGVPGTPPATALLYLQAGQRLDEEACPRDDQRVVVMPPRFVPPIIDTLKGLFQSSERISEQYEKGMMGTGLGFNWFMDQNMRTQVPGTAAAGAITITGANQTGATLTVTGLAAGNFVPGDVVTIGGVHAVNPQNKQNTGVLRDFVILATGANTITVSPAITIAPSPFVTVDVSPAAGAPITPVFTAGTSSQQGCAFHPEAFAFACADLVLPGGVDMAARVADKQLGLSIRAIRAYDINADRYPTRLDILYGFAVLYAEMACRIAG